MIQSASRIVEKLRAQFALRVLVQEGAPVTLFLFVRPDVQSASPQNPILIIKAPILNAYSSPYRNPYRPLIRNPLGGTLFLISKAPLLPARLHCSENVVLERSSGIL